MMEAVIMIRRYCLTALLALFCMVTWLGPAQSMTFMDNVQVFLQNTTRNTKGFVSNTSNKIGKFANDSKTNVTNFVDDKRQLYRDVNTLREGQKEADWFQDEYKPELEKGQKITEDMKNSGFFGKIGAGFRGLAFTGSKRGRHMIRDGVYLMDKYDPVLKRTLDRLGPSAETGEISDEQLHKAAQGGGLRGAIDRWKRNPFKTIFHPSEIKKAYQDGYDETYKIMKSYRNYRKFLHSEKFVARYIRNIAKREINKSYDEEWPRRERGKGKITQRQRRQKHRAPDEVGNRGYIIYTPKKEDLSKENKSWTTNKDGQRIRIRSKEAEKIGVDDSDDWDDD